MTSSFLPPATLAWSRSSSLTAKFGTAPKILTDALIRGTAASETLTGTAASTGYDSGAGNDAMVDVSLSAGGSDWYYWGAGDGNDTINDVGSAIETDKLYLNGLYQESVVLTRLGDDLRIFVMETGEYLTLVGQFGEAGADAPKSGIESVIFADGSELHRSDLVLIAPIAGTVGSNGNDGMQGLPGTSETLSGGRGDDTYRFGRGDGADTVHDAVPLSYWPQSQGDTIAFWPGIGFGDLLVSRNGDDLVIEIQGTADQLTLAGQLDMSVLSLTNRIEFFTFAGGGTLTAAEMDQLMINSQATAGNDLVLGYEGNETYYGGAGNDTLKGYDGSDTYLFGRGYGSDVVDDNGYVDTDAVVFGPDIGISDIVLSRSGNSLQIGIEGTADLLTIYNTFSQTPGVEQGQSIEEFKFSDGTIWTYEHVKLALLAQAKTSGDDTIIGYGGGDVLDGGAGNDTLIGGDGGDTYIFGRGYGVDTISGETASSQADIVQFSDNVIPSDIILLRSGNALIIKIAGTNDQLTLTQQFFLPNCEVEEFRFVDGTVWSQADIRKLILGSLSTSGNDTVVGFDTNDVIDALGGNDAMSGGDGNDIYHWGRGSGVDEISDSLGADEVRLKTGIAPSDIQLLRSGSDVIISIAGTADQLKFSLYEFGQEGIEQVRFENGTIWTDANLRAMLLEQSGTAGNDTITGFNTADTLNGGHGNDTLNGADGSDTYVYSRGDGFDTITDGINGGTADKLLFTNINAASISLQRNGNDVTLVVAESAPGAGDGGSILLKENLDEYASRGVDLIQFADGTVWTRATLRAILINFAGTSGNDTITGTSSADIISGGLGDDTINGGDGSDTYLFARGDGNDTVTENSNGPSLDKIVFGSGIAASDIGLVQNGGNVTLTVAESAPGAGDGGSILLINNLNEFGSRGVEEVQFSDGTVWTRGTIREKLLAQASTAGNDTITGFNTSDTITGGLGNDTINAGDASDIYNYVRGDGNDTITESSNGGNTDAIVFGAGIAASGISLTRNGVDGGNVTLSIAESAPGAGDGGSILLISNLNEFASRGVEEFRFADGTIWTRSTLRSTLLAQAGYSRGRHHHRFQCG